MNGGPVIWKTRQQPGALPANRRIGLSLAKERNPNPERNQARTAIVTGGSQFGRRREKF
jgi:hypothetical protein